MEEGLTPLLNTPIKLGPLAKGRNKKEGGISPPLKTTSPFPLTRGRGIKGDRVSISK